MSLYFFVGDVVLVCGCCCMRVAVCMFVVLLCMCVVAVLFCNVFVVSVVVRAYVMYSCFLCVRPRDLSLFLFVRACVFF